MNIFYLDSNPKLAAEYACDKHVVKMILESAQLLSTAHYLIDNNISQKTDLIYKPGWQKHPCTIWTIESLSNYKWLAEYAFELCKEYSHRYEKNHKSENVIKWCIENPINIIDIGFTKPALAMPIEYHHEDAIIAYRRYYVFDKKVKIKCTWKKRNPPVWFIEETV